MSEVSIVERPLCIWQCSEHPEHRGWRTYDEPRGTCDHCLAMTAFEREVQTGDPQGELVSEQRAIIGRERALIDALTEALNGAIGGPSPSKKTLAQLRRHNASRVWATKRGNVFEVQIVGPDREGPTGHIARIAVEVDRFEASA